MAHTLGYNGSIVALEGTRDTVTTQLRLLPRSPKILVLPPLHYFMPEEQSDSPFDARAYILSIHEACNARIKMARSFMRDSSPDDKKLVFMNGGTASAQMECVNAINQHMVEPDVSRAEETFGELVRHGVAGLKKKVHRSVRIQRSRSKSSRHNETAAGETNYADRLSEAMRAAEALDHDTASLQPSTDMDLTVASRKRSMSFPLLSGADSRENPEPFYVFGMNYDNSTSNSAEAASQLSSQSTHNPLSSTASETLSNDASKPRFFPDAYLSSPSCTGDCHKRMPSLSEFGSSLSPHDTMFGSLPSTPAVVYGETDLRDIRWSPKQEAAQQHKRSRSVDRVYAGAFRGQDVSIETKGQPLVSLTHAAQTPTSDTHKTRPIGYHLPLRSQSRTEVHRAAPAKPKTTGIRRSPPEPLDLSKTELPQKRLYVEKGTSTDHFPVSKTVSGRSYTDHGADAAGDSPQFLMGSVLDIDAAFEPVLPMHEDLVIHLSDENRDEQLDSVIQGFKKGVYPISMPPLLEETESDVEESLEHTPVLEADSQMDARILVPTAVTSYLHDEDEDEDDPFTSPDSYLQRQVSAASIGKRTLRGVAMANAPPTPARTPSPGLSASDKSFHEFSTLENATAVSVQNSLRSVLNVYFSPDEPGYEQFNFPLLPELSSMWKPVFRETEPTNWKKEKRNLDLILAVGAQNSVPKEFVSSLTNSLEKLGVKRNEITRSGRLDLRYLIASAMQSYTSQPLTKQIQDNPFSNPLLLATLMMPHLETYLAAHSDTRFLLLEYPPDHLSTVLELQRLIGADTLKIVGILDSESAEQNSSLKAPKPAGISIHLTKPSIPGMPGANTNTKTTLVSANPSPKSADGLSFSKANFLLTSSATDAEITTLISTIWRILIEISSFYVPERSPGRGSRRSPSTIVEFDGNSVQTPAVEYPPFADAKAIMSLSSRPERPSITKEKPLPIPARKKSKQQIPSRSASIKSSKTVKSVKSARTMLNRLLAPETASQVDGDDLLLRPPILNPHFDFSEDEDGKFYQDERRYMPLFTRKPEVRRGNSRKALKFLGILDDV